jgi:UPF0755 protein
MRKHPILTILIAYCVLRVLALGVFVYTGDRPVPGGRIVVSIPPGTGAAGVGEILADHGIPLNPTLFSIAAVLSRSDTRLGSGTYELGPSVSIRDLLETFRRGAGSAVTVRIPEGATLAEVADLLSENLPMDRDSIIELAGDERFAGSVLPGTSDLEGFLFPDTYFFTLDTTEREALSIMAARFRQVYEEEILPDASANGLSRRQAVILASIIEKEARMPMERKIISGVFHNRLKIGRPIESCATVRFVLDKPKDPLTYRDLRVESPYNTYLHAGLPPGPIGNPGRASLDAAVRPADVDYLYFVARGDGSHIFSKTLEEHNRAKRMLRSNARPR